MIICIGNYTYSSPIWEMIVRCNNKKFVRGEAEYIMYYCMYKLDENVCDRLLIIQVLIALFGDDTQFQTGLVSLWI